MSAKAAHLPAQNRSSIDGLRSFVSDTNLTRIAYEKILKAIVHGKLDLGEPLSENDLAKALGVSKAPIREALNELRLKGLVVVIPQSGTYVFSPTREEIEELCDFRLLLEDKAMRSSMANDPRGLISTLRKVVDEMKKARGLTDLVESKALDTEFHHAFIRHSKNSYLVQAYGNIGHSVEALRYRFMDTAVFRNRAFDEHQKILEFLSSGNVNKAADILADHISRTKQFQSGVNWSTGRSQRKDYKFRDYSDVLSD
jgi:DNA-binding GntR family transcriptional regulator